METLKSLKKGIETKSALQQFLEKQIVRLKEIKDVTTEIEEVLLKAKTITHHWPGDIQERTVRFKYLQDRIDRLKEIKTEIAEIRYMKAERLEELEQMTEQIESRINRFRKLSENIKELKNNKEKQDGLSNAFNQTIADLTYNHLDADISKYKSLFAHLERLRNIQSNIVQADNMISEASKNIDKLVDNLVDALQDAKICGECGQETDSVCVSHVANIV